MWAGSLIFVFKKKILLAPGHVESKGIRNAHNQRELVSSGYLKNWKEPPGFTKEAAKNLQFSIYGVA